MAQNMKISIVNQTGENIIVTIGENETFLEFKEKLQKDHNIFVTLEEFQLFDSHLSLEDNLFNYLRSNFTDEEFNNLKDSPLYEIHLINNSDNQNEPDKDIKAEKDSSTFTIPENNEEYVPNLDTSLIVLNQEPEYSNILQENIFVEPKQTNDQSNPDEQMTYNLISQTSDYQPEGNNTENSNKPTEEIITIDDNLEKNTAENVQTYNYLDIESKLREIHDYTEESLTDWCRLCAEYIAESNKVDIFNDSNELEEKIKTSLPIKLSKEDGLPHQLCESCSTRVKNHFEFYQIVSEADKTLRSKFSQPNIKETSMTELMAEFLASPTKPIKFEPADPPKNEDFEPEYLEATITTKKTLSTIQNCRHCDLIIDSYQDAIAHSVREHRINELFACVFCELGFNTTQLLTEHVYNEHSDTKIIEQYRCKICNMKFVSKPLLLKHSCMKNNRFHCQICNVFFSNKIKLEYHRQFHEKNGNKPIFTCNICDKAFNMRAALLNHKKCHSGVRNHKCEVCNKSFLDKQTLKEHEVSHMETKPFQCHICGKNLNRLSRLRTHLLTHESNLVVNDVHVCSLCQEAFENKEMASVHQSRIHDNQNCIGVVSLDKVLRCEFCEKCFSTAEAIHEHKKCHSGTAPYMCHICKAQFSTYSRCVTHKTTHGLYKDGAEKSNFPVIKHFWCEDCGKSYLHWTYLSLHRRLKHSENSHTYRCEECNLDFPNSWGIAYHRKSRHNQESILCQQCDASFNTQQALKAHRMSSHPPRKTKNYQCIKCEKIFINQITLDAHLKLHQGNREYKCNVCPRSFIHFSGLSNHLKTHTIKKPSPKPLILPPQTISAERPFTCDECGLSFRRQFTLKNHKHKHTKGSDTGSFVLMVDMKEDETENDDSPDNFIQAIVNNDIKQNENFIQIAPQSQLTENYIDISSGNTFNIDGKEYILVDESGKVINHRNHQNFEMIVDETLRDENLISNQQFNDDNSSVMLVDPQNSQFVINNDANNAQSNYIYTTEKNNAPTTTFVIGNEFMLDTNDQNTF